jgi:hypothetical protein
VTNEPQTLRPIVKQFENAAFLQGPGAVNWCGTPLAR